MQKIIFYIYHGVRTYPKEATELAVKFEKLATEHYKNTDIEPIIINGTYGYIGWFANILPFTRYLLENKIKNDLYNLRKLVPDASKLVIVSFSYGTFLTSEVLKKNYFIVDAWILFGGVVHCAFNFNAVRSNICKILNFCSMNDKVAKYAPWLFDYGNCGAYGFRKNGLIKAITDTNFEEVAWEKNGAPWVINIHNNKEEHDSWFKHSEPILEALKKIN